MTSSPGHPEVGPELRALAQAILDRLDPVVRAAAAMATDTLRGPGRCQQVWCPVCALAALASGEQHPMLTVIAEHSVVLMTMVRDLVAEPAAAAENTPQRNGEPVPDETPAATAESPNRYQPIRIVIESDALESHTLEPDSESVSADD